MRASLALVAQSVEPGILPADTTEKVQHFPGGRRKVLHHPPQPLRLPSAEDTLVIVDSGSGRENTGAFSESCCSSGCIELSVSPQVPDGAPEFI